MVKMCKTELGDDGQRCKKKGYKSMEMALSWGDLVENVDYITISYQILAVKWM